MPVAVASVAAPAPWTLRPPAGSLASYAITLTLADGSPYPVAGAAWEYVVRPPLWSSASALITVTTTASASGLVTVETSPATVVTLTLYPAATAALAGTYQHALWMDPGTDGAFAWVTGSLAVAAAPQP